MIRAYIGPMRSDPNRQCSWQPAALTNSTRGQQYAPSWRITEGYRGYVLSAGRHASGFQLGNSPVNAHALHRIVVGGTTSSTGLTPMLEVVPNLSPWVPEGPYRLCTDPHRLCRRALQNQLMDQAARRQNHGAKFPDFIQNASGNPHGAF